ncbi:hypothetical protein D3C87_1949360 [compost metagenome]
MIFATAAVAIGYSSPRTMIPATAVKAAKYFPSTICKDVTGLVKRRSKVLIFFSSAKSFIVKAGTTKIKSKFK